MLTILKEFHSLCEALSKKQKKSLPLCAAENVISPFCKIPLSSFIQEKYIMGGVMAYKEDNNFMEGKDLYKFYQLLNKQCKRLYGSEYADARALSGVNAVMVLLMSLFKCGDTIYVTSEDSGGHSSMPIICRRLGIHAIPLPFDYDLMDYNYQEANNFMQTNRVDGILICPSDILCQPQLFKFNLPEGCILIYDATQTLGLIATGENSNPLTYFSKDDLFILMGATHKTLPGPTCGLILTKNLSLAERFDTKINPDYLRNVQFHHILSLSLVLTEMEAFGKEYCQNILHNANTLGNALKEKGMKVVSCPRCDGYSSTHQVFISMPTEDIKSYIKKCEEFGITLNARYRKLYQYAGIRIGLQEVTRYGWGDNEMNILADILWDLSHSVIDSSKLKQYIMQLSANKKIHYTFSEEEYKYIYACLHNSEL